MRVRSDRPPCDERTAGSRRLDSGRPLRERPSRRRAPQWAALGADAQRLGRDEIARKLRTSAYLGGWIDRRGGAIQPLAFARGLARAAISAGARLHSGEMVTKLQLSGPRWGVETDRGASVDAGRVLLATNGYTGDLAPVLRRTVIAVNSLQIATEPLACDLRATILPGRLRRLRHAPAAALFPSRRAGSPADGRTRAVRRAHAAGRLGSSRTRARHALLGIEKARPSVTGGAAGSQWTSCPICTSPLPVSSSISAAWAGAWGCRRAWARRWPAIWDRGERAICRCRSRRWSRSRPTR
jgi:glycine/D-amino acid oxidase-like deaminating enzyme